MKPLVGLYIRVSTQEQAREGYSINEQTEHLTQYADSFGWTVYKIYSDPGFSGAKLDRPAIQRLILDVEDHKIQKVIVYKLDRLSRSQKDTLFLIEDVFLKNGVDFVSMTENFDTATPFGKAMIGMLSVFAQLEREQIKDRLMLGKVGRAKTGRYLGNSRIITGYDYVDGELIVNPFYAGVVQRIFREFVSGRSTTAIANDLNADGIPTSQGAKWRGSNIAALMRHREYIGQLPYAGEIYEGKQDPIIDCEVFNKAQERLDNRKVNNEMYQRFRAKSSIVTGLCYCTYCQAKREILTGNPDENGVRPRYIGCRKKKEKHCPNPRVPVEQVENAVLNEIRKLQLDTDYLQSVRNKSDDSATIEEIHVLMDRIDENDKKIKRLTDLYVIEGLDINNLKDQVEQLTKENTADRERIRQLKNTTTDGRTDDEIITLANMIDGADHETLIMIVNALIRRIDFDGDTIIINWTF